MSDKDYFVPEQLDDSDFEKEKLEEKRNRKFELGKKQIVKVISIMLVFLLIGIGIYLYLNPIQKKSTASEKVLEDFCAYFNSGNWEKINNIIDFKGYYVLGHSLEEKDYPKFDYIYCTVKKNDENYLEYEQNINTLISSLDEESLKNMTGDRILINSIDACNLIQGTETLYKLRVNYDFIGYSGQKQSGTGIVYVSNADGDYKIVYGDWMELILNYYQTAYMYQSNYGY